MFAEYARLLTAALEKLVPGVRDVWVESSDALTGGADAHGVDPSCVIAWARIKSTRFPERFKIGVNVGPIEGKKRSPVSVAIGMATLFEKAEAERARKKIVVAHTTPSSGDETKILR
jgi:hypothetical protein